MSIYEKFGNRLFDDRYKFLDLLGQGASAEVVRAKDRLLSKEVAVKMLKDLARHDVLADRFFHNEFRAMTQIKHPNIVNVHDFGKSPEGIRYYTMDVVPGAPASKYKRKLQGSRFESLVEDLCNALSAVHAKGCLHCDVKPDNVMLIPGESEHKAILMDFGLNLDLSPDSESSPRGTLVYAAPEMIAGQQIDVRADIYSLGITLLEIISGELPFRGLDFSSVLNAKSSSDPLSKTLQKVPRTYRDCIAKMVSPDPRDRFSSCLEVLCAFAEKREQNASLLPPRPVVQRQLLRPDLIGRDELQKAISQKINDLLAGRGGTVLVAGPRTSGKTRLLEEARYCAELLGATVFLASGSDCASSRPSLSSVLKRATSLKTSSQTGSQDSSGLIEGIAQLAEKTPIVILVDDVHKLCANDISLWRALAYGAAITGYLVISSTSSALHQCSPDLESCVSMMEGDEGFTWLTLEPLDLEQTRTLCRSMLGTTEDVNNLAETIMGTCGGNVGACVAVLSAAAREQRIENHLGHWSMKPVDTRDHHRAEKPSEAHMGFSGLSSQLETVLLAAAVCGQRAPVAMVRRVACRAQDEFADQILRLEAKGLLGWEAVKNRTFIRFLDPSLPQVLIDGADRQVVARLSSAIADVLIAQRSRGEHSDPTKLVKHLTRAGRLEEALRTAMLEGKRCEAAGELSSGIALLETALELGNESEVWEGLEPGELHLMVAKMKARRGESREALANCNEALSHLGKAHNVGDESRVSLEVLLHENAGQICENLSDYRAAIEHYEKSLVLLDSPTRGPLLKRRVELKNALAWAQMLAEDYVKSHKTLEEVMREMDEEDFPDSLARALNTAGWLSLYRGQPREALESFRRGIRVAEERTLDAELESQSVNGAASACWHLGQWMDALSYYEQAARLASALQDPGKRSSAVGNLAVVEYQLGKLPLAEAHFRESLALSVEMGDLEGYVIALNNLGTLLTAQGRADEAKKLLQKARRIARKKCYMRHSLLIEGNLGELLMNEKEHERAEWLLTRVLRKARRRGINDLLPEACRRMARVALELGSSRRFNYYARKSEQLALAAGETHELRRLDRLKARYSAAVGRYNRAEQLFDKAAKAFQENGAAFEEALTKLRWAETCLKRGNYTKAAELLAHLPSTFEEAGAAQAQNEAKLLQKQVAQHQGWGERVAHMLDAFAELRAASNVESALQAAAQKMVSMTGADRGLIIGLNQRGMIQFEASDNFLGAPQEHLMVSTNILQFVTRSKRPLLIESAATDSRFFDSSSIRSLHIGSVICVPIFVEGALQGALYIDSRKPNLFDEHEHLPLAELMAHHVGLFLENVRIANENELVEELVASLAHEMRTPLSAILSSVELMAVPTGKPASYYVKVVDDQVQRLSRLADETIDLIKRKSASRMLSPQVFDVNSLIRHAASALEALTLKRDITLELQLHDQEAHIEGQEDALEQVLINLVSNATKYTGSGGTISIVSRLTSSIYEPGTPASSYLYLSRAEHRWEGAFVTVSIIDDGEGMDELECERIFEKYTRTRKTESDRKIKGSGLGLYICRNIIEQHGGRIWAKSYRGKGTQVTFTLPTVPAAVDRRTQLTQQAQTS